MSMLNVNPISRSTISIYILYLNLNLVSKSEVKEEAELLVLIDPVL